MRENRAPAILIVTHADLGEALLRAAEMIVGHQDGVSALSLWEGESLEAFQVRFQKVGQSPNKFPSIGWYHFSPGTLFKCLSGSSHG